MKVLVAYATAHGSTREIAEHIAARLRDGSAHVECRAVTDVGRIDQYDAVVIGSAIHSQAWLPEARAFAHRHVATLAMRPVWLFSVGMPGAIPRPFQRWATLEGPKVLAEVAPGIGPRGEHLFTGVARPEDFPRTSRVCMAIARIRLGDLRDWDEIDAWADEIAAELHLPALA